MAELTPDRLQELRRIAEAVIEAHEGRRENACGAEDLFDRTFDPPTVLAMLDEIERLRRGWETLAAAVRAWDDYAKTISEDSPLAFYDALDAMEEAEHALERAEQRHCEALALLDGEKGGGE